jgi:hypothetical protein
MLTLEVHGVILLVVGLVFKFLGLPHSVLLDIAVELEACIVALLGVLISISVSLSVLVGHGGLGKGALLIWRECGVLLLVCMTVCLCQSLVFKVSISGGRFYTSIWLYQIV